MSFKTVSLATLALLSAPLWGPYVWNMLKYVRQWVGWILSMLSSYWFRPIWTLCPLVVFVILSYGSQSNWPEQPTADWFWVPVPFLFFLFVGDSAGFVLGKFLPDNEAVKSTEECLGKSSMILAFVGLVFLVIVPNLYAPVPEELWAYPALDVYPEPLPEAVNWVSSVAWLLMGAAVSSFRAAYQIVWTREQLQNFRAEGSKFTIPVWGK